MHVWYEYRTAWAVRPWLALLAGLAVVVIVLAVVETVLSGPLALLFIPGLALLYGHHLLVRRYADRDQ